MSIGYCWSLSRFCVKLQIYAAGIDQMTNAYYFFPSVQIELCACVCICICVRACMHVWFLTAHLYLWVSSQCWMGNCAFSVCPLLCGKSCYLRLYWNTNGIDLDLRLIGGIVLGYWSLSMSKWIQSQCIELTKWDSATSVNDRLVFFSRYRISNLYVLKTDLISFKSRMHILHVSFCVNNINIFQQTTAFICFAHQ